MPEAVAAAVEQSSAWSFGDNLTSIVSLHNTITKSKLPELRAELTLDGQNAKREFAFLERDRAAIEKTLGFPLTWHNNEDKASCRIYTSESAEFSNETLWPEQFAWLRQRLEAMQNVFVPFAKRIRDGEGV